jgi:hypothetical protein
MRAGRLSSVLILTAVSAFAGPAAGAAGRSQGHLALRTSPPASCFADRLLAWSLTKGHGGVRGEGAAVFQKGIPQLPYPVRSSGTSANSASVSRFFSLHWALFMHGLIGDQLAHAHARARQSRPVLRCSHFGSECRGRRKKCTGYS